MTSEERLARLRSRIAKYTEAAHDHARLPTADSARVCGEAAAALADHYRTATGAKGHFMPVSNHGHESALAWDTVAANYAAEAQATAARWLLFQEIQAARAAGVISAVEREHLREEYLRGALTAMEVRAALAAPARDSLDFPFIL